MKLFTYIFVAGTVISMTGCGFEGINTSDYQSIDSVFTRNAESLTYQSSDTGEYESVITYGVSDGNYAIVKFDNVYDYNTKSEVSDYYGICLIDESESGTIKLHSPKSFIVDEDGKIEIVKSKYVSNIGENTTMFDWEYYVDAK